MEPLLERSFVGHSEWLGACEQALSWAAAQPCRQMQWWDAHFLDWPLSAPGVLEALRSWAGPGRNLQLLALDYDGLPRRHPRFVQWRRTFDHCVNAAAADPEVRPDAGPSALLLASGADRVLSVRLFDRQRWRGRLSFSHGDFLREQQWFDAVAQRSSPSFAATTLGL